MSDVRCPGLYLTHLWLGYAMDHNYDHHRHLFFILFNFFQPAYICHRSCQRHSINRNEVDTKPTPSRSPLLMNESVDPASPIPRMTAMATAALSSVHARNTIESHVLPPEDEGNNKWWWWWRPVMHSIPEQTKS